MKQKNYDVQQMYKEYMQGVGSDPTAIEDILSGERQPANTGARIKHSTGKAATIAATAAVIAICAGIGFSNMNANDDSSIKPAAATTTTAVTPAKQTDKGNEWYISNAYTDSFKLEASPIKADKSLAKMTVTLTAKDEKGREIIKEYGKKGDMYISDNKIALGGDSSHPALLLIDSTGYNHGHDMNWDTVEVTEDKVVFDCRIILHTDANEDLPFTINAFIPGNKTLTDEEIANGAVSAICIASAKLTYKVNQPDYTLRSQSGEEMTVSDVGMVLHHDAGFDDKNTKEKQIKFTFADGTQKTLGELEPKINGGGGTINNIYSYKIFFTSPIGAKNIVSVTYDGIQYTKPSDAKISIEKTIVDSSERAFSIEMLIKADNDAGRELLKKNASSIKFTINESVSGMTVCSSQSSAKFEKDRLSVYITGSIYGKHVEKVAVEMKPDPSIPSEVLQALGTSGTIPTILTELPKTLTDKVFVSATGEHFWLSELFATTDHNRSSKKASPAVFKLKDGDEVSESDYNTSRAGNTDQKQETIFFNKKFPYEPSDVASIIYDGVEFKAK